MSHSDDQAPHHVVEMNRENEPQHEDIENAGVDESEELIEKSVESVDYRDWDE